jgi:ATP-dependent Clp protease, protease subunit
MSDIKDFKKYAADRFGISSLTMHRYHLGKQRIHLPTIIEERQLNVASMDVFSRLMMDRIIFLGLPVDDYVANIIQAQLLYLDSADPGKDIQIYLNTPGGAVHAGMGIYDTMQYISADVATICTGMAASMGAVLLTAGAKGKRLGTEALPHHDPSADGWCRGTGIRHRDSRQGDPEGQEGALRDHRISYRQNVEKVEKDADRDHWMTAVEAKEYGMIDEVLIKNKEIIFSSDG